MIFSDDERRLLSQLLDDLTRGYPYLLESDFESAYELGSADSLIEQGLIAKVLVNYRGTDRYALHLVDFQQIANLLRAGVVVSQIGQFGPRSRPSALAEKTAR